MASHAVWGTTCRARLVFAPRPERNARNGQPRNLAAFWLLQCYNVKETRMRGVGRGKVSASPLGGPGNASGPICSHPIVRGEGGWGHCDLKHAAGQLSDEGGGVQCRLPRIIPTNKLDTNTCQNVVKHVGEQTNGEAASMLFDIGCGCSIPLVLCVELHSTLGRRASGHWSSKLPRDDRHNPD